LDIDALTGEIERQVKALFKLKPILVKQSQGDSKIANSE
jgi:hypothetical protein